MASREAMNMGSRSSNVISELKSVISLLGQATDSAFQKVTSGISRTSSFSGSGTNASSSLVAPNPVFNAPAISYVTETGSGLVSSGPSESNNLVARGPGTNLTQYVSQNGGGTTYRSETSSGGGGVGGTGGGLFGGGRGGNSSATPASQQGYSNIPGIGTIIGAAFGAYNVGANLTPNTSDVLEAQLLQQRASFYTGANSKLVPAADKQSRGAVQGSQQNLANLAMLSGDNPQMDVMRAQIAAQSYGLGSNMNNLMTSAANVSNLMPGLGVEGSIRATGAMQQASSVNMLRGIGIQLRGPDGTMKGPDAVIDDVWAKICKDYGQAYGSGKTPSLKEIQISLQPGNAIDSMLNQYFGNDPMLKQLVANGLIYKAQGGLAINKAGVTGLGGTTEAMTSYTQTAAAGQGYLVNSQDSAESGFIGGNTAIRTFYTEATKGLLDSMMKVKAYTDTLLTAFGGNPLSAVVGAGGASTVAAFNATVGATDFLKQSPTEMLKNLFSALFANLGFKAEGGYVSSNTPYIVGEKGPELFVPNNSGTIVPNNELGAGSTYNYSFTINAASGNTQDLVTEIKSVLVQLETNRKVSES
jgi:hypothetical protein